jgi:hypothetical protein
MVCRPGKPPLVVAKSRAFARRCEELRKKMHMSLTDGDKLREREKKMYTSSSDDDREKNGDRTCVQSMVCSWNTGLIEQQWS